MSNPQEDRKKIREPKAKGTNRNKKQDGKLKP